MGLRPFGALCQFLAGFVAGWGQSFITEIEDEDSRFSSVVTAMSNGITQV